VKHKDILSTVGRTPVVRLNRLAPEGVEVWVKVEAFNPLGSVKDRLALGVIEAAERGLAKVRDAAARALELDRTLAKSHLRLASYWSLSGDRGRAAGTRVSTATSSRPSLLTGSAAGTRRMPSCVG